MAIRRIRLLDGTIYEIHGDGLTDTHADDIVRQLNPPPISPPPGLPPEPPSPSRIPGATLDWLKGGVSHYFTEPNADESGQLRVGRPHEFRQRAAEVLSTPLLPPPPEPPTDIPSLTPRMFGPSKSVDALYGMARGMSSPLNLGMMAAAPTLWPSGMAGKALGVGLGVPMAAEGIRQMQAGESVPGAVNVALAALPLVGGFKGKVVPPFYSQLERVIEAKMPNVTTVDQLAGILRDPSIKQTEMEATGLGRWLDTLRGSTRKITKQEVRTQLGLGKVELKDVGYGQTDPEVKARLEGIAREMDRASAEGQSDRVAELQLQYANALSEGSAKFDRPSLILPGGKRYREKLLTMPGGRERVEYKVTDQYGKERGVFPTEGQAKMWINQNANREWYQQHDLPAINPSKAGIERVVTQEPYYTEPHFDVDNVVAHGRFTNRTTTAGEEMLFGEELQSQAALDVRKAQAAGEPSPWKGFPFEKNWHELMLWKALRMAAEEDKTRFGWTTGEQQIARYGLEKHVDRLLVRKNPHDTGWHIIGEKGGTSVVRQRVENLSDLDGYIGRELAEKARADLAKTDNPYNGVSYSGLDLKVGGEGKRQLYDQMLVQAANRIGKRYGVKAEDVQIGVKPKYGQPTMPQTVHSLPITPELRAALLGEGRPLFQSPLPWLVGASAAGVAAGAAAGKGEAADKAADRNKPVLHPPPPPLPKRKS
jgi:hypothetical protein